MKSKTSVIITTYNDSKFLKRSIPSIINQSLEPLEIIIIDDCSNDNEAEKIVQSYSDQTHIPIVFKRKIMADHLVHEISVCSLQKGNLFFL